MRICTWSLSPGGREGQETREEKRMKGLEYIRKLGDEVLEYKEENDKFVITLKDE